MIAVMPNEKPAVPMTVENLLFLPPCCPVSGNPQPGSVLTIRYVPRGCVLEVCSLRRYIQSYVGGRGEIRSMEAMIQQIAEDCAASVGVPVQVVADLFIAPEQRMIVRCEA